MYPVRKVLKLVLPVFLMMLVVAGCGLLGDGEDLNHVRGQVFQLIEDNFEGVQDVNISLSGEKSDQTTTVEGGFFSFRDLPDGTYTFSFENEGEIDDSAQRAVAGGGEAVLKFYFDEDGKLMDEDEIPEGYGFALNLKEHGINMVNLGEAQMEVIEDSMEQLEPFGMGMSSRMGLVAWSFMLWDEINYPEPEGEILSEEEERTFLPGDFYFYPDEEDEYVLNDELSAKKEYEDVKDNELWNWNLYFADAESGDTADYEKWINFVLTNPDDVYNDEGDEDYDGIIDIRKGLFEYSWQADIDDVWLEWGFTFSLESDEYEIHEFVVEDIENGEEEWKLIYPLNPSLTIKGGMEDTLHEHEEWGAEFPEEGRIEELDLQLDLVIDQENEEGSLNYEGSIITPVGSHSGSASIQLSNFDLAGILADPENVDELPMIDEFYMYGEIVIDGYFMVSGDIDLSFVYLEENTPDDNFVKMPMPDGLTINGSYADLSGDEDGFSLQGHINLTADYEGYEFDQDDGEDNYFTAQLLITGELVNTGFDDGVYAEMNVHLTGYEKGTVDMVYEFGHEQYIEGTGSFEGDEFEFEAENELGQIIVFVFEDTADGMKIGELLDSDRQFLADIMYEDQILYFEFEDGTVIEIV